MEPKQPSRLYRVNLWLHRWCSLLATLPFLILCLTGTVLIFHEEIDAALGVMPDKRLADDQAHLPLQAAIDNILAAHPDERVATIGLDPDNYPGLMLMVTVPNDARDMTEFKMRFAELASAQPTEHVVDPTATLTGFLLELHAHWFLGMPGELIGAVIALLVLTSLISGIVVYAPYVRKVAFGMLRRGRGKRLLQLDLHNLLGAVVLGWALVVTLSGFLLGFGTLATGIWQYTALHDLREQRSGQTLDARRPPANLDAVVAAAKQAAPPDWRVSTVVYPNTEFSTPRHFTALVNATAGLEGRMFQAALVDAESGEVAALKEMPGYMKAIILAQPLHFGDYGGLPLKILWTACTWLTLFITANGAWLWWDRRRKRQPRAAVEVTA